MYNYRVRDLKALIYDLKNKNITVSTDKFSWTIDPDGNKVLLSQL
jgi:outer membrane lipoprotein-sorting protein